MYTYNKKLTKKAQIMSMHFVEDLSKGILGKSDSVQLWIDILRHIPINKLKYNKHTRFLFPAVGQATEVKIMVSLLSGQGWTSEQIINAFYIVDKYRAFTNPLKRMGFVHVYTQDFIALDIKDSKGNIMKFDVIVGNPPYQKGNQELWKHFIHKSYPLLKNNGIMSFITPRSWTNGANVNTKENIFNYYFKTNTMLEIRMNTNSFFNIGKNTSYWILQNTPPKKNQTVKILDVNNNEIIINISNLPFFLNDASELGLEVFNFIKDKPLMNSFTETSKEFKKCFAFPKAKHISYNKFGYKISIGENDSYPTSKIKLVFDMTSESDSEVENLYNQFNDLSIFKCLWQLYGANGDASSFGWVLRNMPKLSLSTKWTDELVQQHFGWDDKLQAFILDTAKLV